MPTNSLDTLAIPVMIPNPMNYISIVRQLGTIRGAYTIDPALRIPNVLLPIPAPWEKEDTRRHLALETRTGTINTDIRLVDRESFEPILHRSGKVVLDVQVLIAGSITVKLVCYSLLQGN